MNQYNKKIIRTISQAHIYHLPGDIRSMDGEYFKVENINSKDISSLNDENNSIDGFNTASIPVYSFSNIKSTSFLTNI